MGFLSDLFSSGATKAREEAVRLGMHVAVVDRDCPYFSRDGGSVELRKGSVVRYSLPRTAPDRSATWALLQRTKSLGATLPNDYLLVSSAPLPDRLNAELTSLAQDFDEEYFEFEATLSEVVVYWEEWGGPKQAQVLHHVLSRLAAT